MFFLVFSWSAPTSALATRLRRRNPAAVTLVDCLAHQRHSALHVRPRADAPHTSNGGATGPRDGPVPSRNTSEGQATREQPNPHPEPFPTSLPNESPLPAVRGYHHGGRRGGGGDRPDVPCGPAVPDHQPDQALLGPVPRVSCLCSGKGCERSGVRQVQAVVPIAVPGGVGGEVGYAARGGALPGPRVRSFSRRGLIEAVSYGTRRRKGDGGTSTCPFFFLSLPVSDPRPPAALARPPFTEGPHQRGEHGVRQLYPTRVETSPS